MPKASSRYDFAADVVIVGGGHAGCTMAALLAKNGVRAICIDQDDPATTLHASFDGRTTAISFGSRRVIAATGVWDSLEAEACPIRDIKIMDSGSPTLLEFLAEDVGEDAFGWIVENRSLRKSLYETLKRLKQAQHVAPARVKDFTRDADGVTVHLEDGRTARGKLVIGADGRGSFTREWMGIGTRGWSYDQRAVVCIVHHEKPHNNTAIEDFRSEGPFAVLPMEDDDAGRHRSSIVWTEHCHEKDSAVRWDEKSFNAALAERFPSFYGKVSLAGTRFAYPLGLKHAHTYIADRMALVADAAHGIHPIAGQGLNLGLRDIAELAELIITAKNKNEDPGDMAVLDAYQRARRFDNMAMAGATDTLNKLFSNDLSSVRLMRKIGLRLVQRIPTARRFFMRQAMGASGLLPELVKTGKLSASTRQ
jgi:2-octaprenyl-6-methoxyphenol hydroxylase